MHRVCYFLRTSNTSMLNANKILYKSCAKGCPNIAINGFCINCCYMCRSNAKKIIMKKHETKNLFSTTIPKSEDSTSWLEGTVLKADLSEKCLPNMEESIHVHYDPSTLSQDIYKLNTLSYLEKHEEKEERQSEAAEIKKNTVKERKKKQSTTKCEHLEKKEKHNFFSQSLKSYIQVCGHANMNQRAHDCLLYYRYKNELSGKSNTDINISIYNTLLNCWASEGNLGKFKEVMNYMDEDGIKPDLQTYAANLECLSRCSSSTNVKSQVQKISEDLKAIGKSFSDIFHECIFNGEQLQEIEKVLDHKFSIPLDIKVFDTSFYSCKLVEKLNERWTEAKIAPYINDGTTLKDIENKTLQQMELETDYTVKVKSVCWTNEAPERVSIMRKYVKDCEGVFVKQLSSALDLKFDNLRKTMKGRKSMALYPYIHVIEKDVFINVMLQEIRWIIESAEFFSPNLKILCQNMGNKIMNLYFIQLKKKNKVTDKVTLIYSKYLEYLLNPELCNKCTPREYWEHLKHVYCLGPTIDVPDVRWPHHIIYEVGKFVYDILLRNLLFDVNKLKRKSKGQMMVPPFYTIYERNKKISSFQFSFKLSLEIRAHPKISKLYRAADLTDLEFDVGMVPMLCPPRPWISTSAGGLLMTPTPFIRVPPYAHHVLDIFTKVPKEQITPCLDSLNVISMCPWIINKPILDLIIQVFRNNGNKELDVPLNPNVHFPAPEVKASMSDSEKKAIIRQKFIVKKQKMEATSLWFDCLYKLSIANKFRDKTFWFPHNLDFRGRAYPTPPHFNHLGSDMVRSILLFSEGKSLGKKGLDWLKIHLINLTGFKKRETNAERLKYANEMMPEILDSADKPFNGNLWWQTSDEPWQTLACCKEIAKVARSPDPENFVSHFPIHQDGSCNGLQHYAALGRDEYGAREVNLSPSPSPQDVYSGVAALVEEARQKDASKGNETASVLEGFIKRKVVKQTIMTFVYGVTEYGARLQILKQLKDLPDFPEEHRATASRYLMKHTFLSIQKMFTATREIQKWFTDCAELITKITGEPVEWVTPLGLPVVQPYHKKATVSNLTDFVKGNASLYSHEGSYTSTYEKYKLPNVRKQKNAFAPNFIHSLDSCHMMLTSLFCQREGITFVSVHDCYWTHPETVEIMNKVCREQFVSLHSEPILEKLSEFFLNKYGKIYLEDNAKQIEKLKVVLGNVPQKGTFNLNSVLESEYFFS